jgi:hypothetical protein
MSNEKDNVVSLRDVSLSTLSVNIRVIRVGTKQMTLAVLRQLKREPILNCESLTLTGVPWGLVKDAAKEVQVWVGSEYGHSQYERFPWFLVWQKGEELRVSPVNESVEADWKGPFEPSKLDRLEPRRGAVLYWGKLYVSLPQLFVAV